GSQWLKKSLPFCSTRCAAARWISRSSRCPSAATSLKNFLCSASASLPHFLRGTNLLNAARFLLRTFAPNHFCCFATATVFAITRSRRVTAPACIRKLFLRVASSAVFSAWWEPGWAYPSFRKWLSRRNRAAAMCALMTPPLPARVSRLSSARARTHAHITRFSPICVPRPHRGAREAFLARSFEGSSRSISGLNLSRPLWGAHPGVGRLREDSTLFHGNRHVVKIQCQSGLVEQLDPHGCVEEAIRLVHIRSREEDQRGWPTQGQAAEAFLLRKGFFHLYAAIREREVPGFCSLGGGRELQLFNRGCVDEKRAAIHGVDLRRRLLSINFKSIGHHNRRSLFAEFYQRNPVASSG